ncbi:patatin-like phospholipase family protein [uncultured Acetobacteroides sp.]|uniref:patatin-like phospholipase family protein n=1 Tax=uncultured Acetobacteroides sp. TaxID=1760811 RepID=UPI0029F57DA4|nr:patatin-like phospholipase family protein [uncultured Acetobacteroides sp.]
MKQAVSLVLSSGGARGIAHIGVIEELERQGFEIKSIAGSSMGALVGGMYASGNLEVFKSWICKIDKKAMINLADFTLSKNGLVKGNKIINELKKITPDINIEDLPISYKAIATDIESRNEIVFEKNSLFDAIRSSISIPGFFTPNQLNDMVLIDGAVSNPLLVNRVKRCKDDLLIVVDVSGPISIKKSSSKNDDSSKLKKSTNTQFNYYSLLTQSSSIMIQQMSALMLNNYQPDILISIPMNSYGSFEFYKSEEILKIGEMVSRIEVKKFKNRFALI